MRFLSLPKTVSCLFACMAFAIIMSIDIAHATIYYVATTGSDGNPGTTTQPLRTIAKGILSLSAGDTLYVKAGTYAESIDTWKIPFANGTSWDNPITVAANPGDTVIINPKVGSAFFWVADGQRKFLIIKGFIVDGANSASHGFKFEGETKYVRVIDCEIKNTKKSGILVTGYANTYHTFTDVNVHNSGSSSFDHGVYITTSNNVIEQSEIYQNKGFGIHIYSGSSTAHNNIIRNNTLHDNNTLGTWGCGLLLSSGTGNVAYNNVAYGNFAGFCIAWEGRSSRLYNNIAYGNDIYGIYVGISSTDGSRIENNTVYKNATYGIFVGNGAINTTVKNNIANANGIDLGLTGATSSNNLINNPLFVNAAGKDFRLQSSSLAIDKGTSISGLNSDLDGKPRPKGAAFDIGAFEYQGSTSTSGSTSSDSTSSGSTSSGSTTTTTTTSFPPPLASPAPGTTLTTSTVTFTGAHSSQDLSHWIYIGSSPGGSNYYGGALNANHQVTVSGLPSSGTVYVKYMSRNSSGWFSQQHTFTMSVGDSTSSSTTTSTSSSTTTTTASSFPPPLASPAPGTTLTTSTVTFTGAHSSQDLSHWIYIGSSPGGSNYYGGALNANHQVTVSGLPSSGTVYVKYMSRNSSGWQSQTFSYFMNR